MAIFRAIGQSRCTTIKISIAGGATIPRQSSHPLVRWEEQWVPQDVFHGKTFLSKIFSRPCPVLARSFAFTLGGIRLLAITSLGDAP